MQCCGSRPKKDIENLLKEVAIRKKVETTLNDIRIEYDVNKSNIGQLVPAERQFYDRKIIELQRKLEDKNKEMDELERKYLAKIAELLILTQVHCEIKTDINATFDKLGISIQNVEKQRLEEIDDDEDVDSQQKERIGDDLEQSFKQN